MSQGQPMPYKVDQGSDVNEQIQEIIAAARQAGKLGQVKEILKRAMDLLRIDPEGWGDPEYRAKTVAAIRYRGIIRPILFRYAVYEQTRSVVLLTVKQFADFD